ncbi:substrate-binding periplasmic protein [Chitinimonas sp. PSY-7]|uniref:transporter substrate-binding domain-containing protein n=1 Tax=Chitinimonas sp. PSY-7 TaxID=3459088 RepID=UPI00403FD128
MFKRLFCNLIFIGAMLGNVAFSQNAQAEELLQFVTTEYPPYTTANLPNGGIITAIATEAFKRGGYNINVTILPWARALREGTEGRVDGIVAIWHSVEREQWFIYSNPIAPNQIGFFKRVDSPIRYKNLSDLKPYTIGTVRGYANPPAFDEAKLNTVDAVDDETNLRKLGAKRLDLVLIDKGVAQYLIDLKIGYLMGKLVWMGPAIEAPQLYVVLSKSAPDKEKKLEAFNRGLQLMEKDGTLAKLIAEAGI